MSTRERESRGEESQPQYAAVGYTNRRELDRFITGEEGDLVVHGPVHARDDLDAVSTLGTGATEGTPCLVVPLIRERMDEIQREISEVLNRFEAGGAPGAPTGRPRTIGETGGSARGASAGALRTGSVHPEGEDDQARR